MKRNIIEKLLRLNQIRDVYAEQIKELGKKQITIHQKLIREFKLEGDWQYSDYLSHDWIEIDAEGYVQLWERGRCGDPDMVLSSFSIDPLIISGDLEGYEKKLRVSFQTRADQVLQAKQQETKSRREQLEKELARINGEIVKLSS